MLQVKGLLDKKSFIVTMQPTNIILCRNISNDHAIQNLKVVRIVLVANNATIVASVYDLLVIIIVSVHVAIYLDTQND